MLRKDIEEKYPFISLIQYGGKEYVGIIVNQDQYITSVYDYSLIKTMRDKKYFLQLGEIWWMESNRLLPITIFLQKHMPYFRFCLKNMNTKDVNILLGPVVNLGAIQNKRIKRKSIQMIRKPKK
jgi:hypothetical protein